MDIAIIEKMKHSPLHNYAGIPGLTSWLIAAPSEKGAVRFFECSRNHIEYVHPHSHRFDFECKVLAGFVINTIWREPGYDEREKADLFGTSALTYLDEPGKYTKTEGAVKSYLGINTTYGAGESYSMRARDIHSIRFSKGARVLFFEGPPVMKSTYLLEPHVNGRTVPTFKVEPWMFSKE